MSSIRTVATLVVPLVSAGCCLSHGSEPDEATDGGLGHQDAPNDSIESVLACGTEADATLPYCCVQACGDGVRDPCRSDQPCPGPGGWDGVCPDLGCPDLLQPCDGTDLGGASCESLGFARGNLSCGCWCGFDTRLCDDCLAETPLSPCGHLGVDDRRIVDVATAWNGSTIAVAWISGDTLTVRFALLSPDLAVVARNDAVRTDRSIWGIALAPAESGWILATGHWEGRVGSDRTTCVRVDDTGTPAAAEWTANGVWPKLFPVAGGGAILLRSVPNSGFDSLYATRLGPAGEPGIDVLVSDSASSLDPISTAADLAGATLVAFALYSSGIQVARIEADGVVSAVTPVGSTGGEFPCLASNGSDGRLLWWDEADGLTYARLDAYGAVIGAPVALLPGQFYLPSRAVTVGNDLVALLATGLYFAPDLFLLQVAPDGSAGSAPVPMTMTPNELTDPGLAAGGTQALVSWLDVVYPSHLTLRWVTP